MDAAIVAGAAIVKKEKVDVPLAKMVDAPLAKMVDVPLAKKPANATAAKATAKAKSKGNNKTPENPALQALLDQLDSTDPAADAIKLVPTKIRKAAFKACKDAMTKLDDPRLKEAYSRIETDKDRRQWLLDFALDKTGARCLGTQTTERSVSSRDGWKYQWLTESELASPTWLNSKGNTTIAIKSMVSQKHQSNDALREAGVLQYQHWYQVGAITGEQKTTIGIKAEVDLTHGEFEEVSNAMCATEGGGPLAKIRKLEPAAHAQLADQQIPLPASSSGEFRQPVPLPAPITTSESVCDEDRHEEMELSAVKVKQERHEVEKESVDVGIDNAAKAFKAEAEKKDKKDAQELLSKNARQLKALSDRITREFKVVRRIETKLTDKIPSWGRGPLEYLQQEIHIQSTASQKCFQKWIEIQTPKEHESSPAEMRMTAAELETQFNETLESWKKFTGECLTMFGSIK